MGYRLNCLDKPVFIAVSKPLLTEFGIYHRLESCVLGRVSHHLTSVRLIRDCSVIEGEMTLPDSRKMGPKSARV